MKRKWIVLACIVALALFGMGASITVENDNQEVSLADYFAEKDGENAEEETGPTPEPTDYSQPVYELDGSTVITLTFTGDFTIGDNVQSKGKSIFQKELEKQKGDIHFPFRNIRDILQADDLTVINFEGTLTTADRNPDKKNNDFLFRAPPEYGGMLVENGVEACSFENNHAMDMGQEGNDETKQVLTQAGVHYASEGEPALITVRGVKVGLLAYQTFGGRHDELIGKVPEDIAGLRQQGCDVVVVNYHWGNEKDYAPNNNQVRLGRATIDGGADLVIGHHSHRINPIEYYNGKYICYSLGNFSFAGNNKPDDMSTYLFQIKLRVKEGNVTDDGFIIIPCRISSRTDYNDFAPTPYSKEQNTESLLSVLKSNGKNLDYAVQEYPTKWPGDE